MKLSALASFLLLCMSSVYSDTVQDAATAALKEVGCGQGLLGGYYPVESRLDSLVLSYAKLAADEYAAENPTTNTVCSSDSDSISVVSACKQVVAGTNYAILYNNTCNGQTKLYNTVVYQPLGYTNEPVSVTRVELVE